MYVAGFVQIWPKLCVDNLEILALMGHFPFLIASRNGSKERPFLDMSIQKYSTSTACTTSFTRMEYCVQILRSRDKMVGFTEDSANI